MISELYGTKAKIRTLQNEDAEKETHPKHSLSALLLCHIYGNKINK